MNQTEKDAAYKYKQDWIEAVMADSIFKAVIKVFAFGVYTHMFGTKDESWPGKDAIHKATNLGTGHYSEYTKALEKAGYLEVTRRLGTSNLYRLALPTPNGGNHPHPLGGTVPPTGVAPTPNGGTNITRNTSINTSREINKDEPVGADAPTVTFNKIELEGRFIYYIEDVSSSTNKESSGSAYLVDPNGVTKQSHLPPMGVGRQNPGSEAPVERNPAKAALDWVDAIWD